MAKRKSKEAEAKKKLLNQLKRQKPRKLDSLMHQAHDNAFSCINCLECANCCTTTGPLLTDTDIKRISKHLRMKEVDFAANYVREDEDGDLLGLKSLTTLKNVNPFAMAANLFTEEDEGVEEDVRNQIVMVSED